MKKLAILTLFLFSLFGVSKAAGFEVYYVSMQKILNESAKGKQAKSILESKVREVQEKAKRMQQEIEKLKKELSNPVLSQKAKAEKENQLQQKIRDLQRFQQDSRADIANLERQYTYQIINDVVKVISNYRKENKIPIILEKNEAGIISADPKYDITDKIIKIYDSQVK